MNTLSRYFVAILVAIFASNVAIADCDWSTIVELPSHSYSYSPELHLCVGNLVQQNKVQLTQIDDLQAAIQLKDLAITTSEKRIELWQKTSDDSQARLASVESDSKRNDLIMFGLGALTVIASGWMASRLLHP